MMKLIFIFRNFARELKKRLIIFKKTNKALDNFRNI